MWIIETKGRFCKKTGKRHSRNRLKHSSEKLTEENAVQLTGQTLLITGASGAIGRALIADALRRGARRIYAADLDPPGPEGAVVPMRLDITDHAAVARAAENARDVTVLINNAGVNRRSTFLGAPDMAAARQEMEVNYFGTLATCRAFAPVLGTGRGAAIVCMLSILAKVTLPNLGSYCASKAALLRLCEGLRAELAHRRVGVLAAMPWAVDTPMSALYPGDKSPVEEVAAGVLDAVEQDAEEVYFHAFSDWINEGLRTDPQALVRELGERFVQAR